MSDLDGFLLSIVASLVICIGAGLVVRHWPLARRSTVTRWRALLTKSRRRVILAEIAMLVAEAGQQDAQKKADTAEGRARSADRQMTSMQATFSRSMREMHEPWSIYAAKVLHKVQKQSYVAAFISEPVLTVAHEDDPVSSPVSYRQYPLIKFTARMNLSEDCPPELVADQIADQVRSAVLSQWRHQSLLATP